MLVNLGEFNGKEALPFLMEPLMRLTSMASCGIRSVSVETSHEYFQESNPYLLE